MLLWSFWRWGLANHFPRLASTLDPPDLSLPSSWDYRSELLLPDPPSFSLPQAGLLFSPPPSNPSPLNPP
jgi:hypothetical protein